MAENLKTATNLGNKGTNLYPATLSLTFGDESMELDVPEGVWNPTPHGLHLGNTLMEMDFTGQTVLEIGTGCGIHAILLARRGAGKLILTEIQTDILNNAKHNLSKHAVNIPVEYIKADWTHVDGTFDVVVTNPPFAKSGKTYLRYFIDTLILDAYKLLKNPGGRLVFIHSSMADIPRTQKLLKENGFDAQIIAQTTGPFREYYYEDQTFLDYIQTIPNSYQMIDGQKHETLVVFEAVLR